MSERQELIKVATRLGLEFRGNAKTTVIKELVDAKLKDMNKTIIVSEEKRGVVIPEEIKELVSAPNRGNHPITGEPV